MEHEPAIASRILASLDQHPSYRTVSVRMTRETYNHIQEIASITGKKPAAIMRACLAAGVEELISDIHGGI